MRERLGRFDSVLGGLVVVATGVRLWGLGRQSFWYDEWLSLRAISGSPVDVARHVAHREGCPPGYFAVLWVWERVFGSGEVALRSLSVVAGVATVPVVYAAVLELGQPRRSARVAAVLVALHPALVWYSQEARPYSLLGCAAALSLWGFARLWQRDDDRVGRAVWAASCVGLVALHYFGAFLVVAELGALLVLRRDDRRRLLLAAVPSAIALAALVPVSVEQHSHEGNRQWINGFSLRTRLGEAGRSALAGPAAPDGRWWAVSAAVVLVAAVVLALRGEATARRTALVVGAVGAGAATLPTLLAVSGIQDSLVGRYLIAALVPLCVAAAIALGGTAPRWVGLGGLVITGVLAVATVRAVIDDPDLHKPDWQAVADVFADTDSDTGDERLLVLTTHQVMGSPLRSYVADARPLAPDEVSRAEAIDVVTLEPTDDPCNFLVGQACSLIFLGGPLPEPLAHRTTLVDRVQLDQFSVERYRVDDPGHGITTADLVAPEQLPGALVLVAGD